MNNIQQKLQRVKNRIKTADKNNAVILIAVTKTKSVAQIQQAINAQQKHFGENYLNEALEKITQLKNQNIIWHFIGSIQSNKTAKIANNFTWVHSVGKLKIAQKLNHHRLKSLGKLNILLQINIDKEPTKSGFFIEDIAKAIEEIKQLSNISLKGFMCIPDKNNSQAAFQKMQKLLQDFPDLKVLSMGMSQDLEIAIEYGATFVRVGTDIFGKRQN